MSLGVRWLTGTLGPRTGAQVAHCAPGGGKRHSKHLCLGPEGGVPAPNPFFCSSQAGVNRTRSGPFIPSTNSRFSALSPGFQPSPHLVSADKDGLGPEGRHWLCLLLPRHPWGWRWWHRLLKPALCSPGLTPGSSEGTPHPAAARPLELAPAGRSTTTASGPAGCTRQRLGQHGRGLGCTSAGLGLGLPGRVLFSTQP